MILDRRGLLGGLLALGAAPAIVRTPGLLMPISSRHQDLIPSPATHFPPPDAVTEVTMRELQLLARVTRLREVVRQTWGRPGFHAAAAAYERALCEYHGVPVDVRWDTPNSVTHSLRIDPSA